MNLSNRFSKIKQLIIKEKSHLIFLLIYSILGIVFTYPVAFSAADKIPGMGDVYFYLWDLWWFKTALLNLSSPYYTDYLFYPIGINLAFSAITPFNGILSIPLQLIFGLIRVYDILWIISFIISGYGTFLLVKYLINDTRAAFISGLIFMFSPYHFAHALGHLNLLAIEWIPFYILFLFKTLKENGLKNPLYSSFFLFLTALCEYTYMVYLLFFTLFFLLNYVLIDRNNIQIKNTINKFIVMFIFFSIIFLPFAYPLLKELLTSNSSYMYSGEYEKYSADLLGFLMPSQLHPLFGEYVSPIYKNFTGNIAENTVFAGYTVLFLAFFAVLKNKYKEINFWAFSVFIFFILSLGPKLHINGVSNFSIGGHTISIPLPYLFLIHIPIVSIARVPSRWDVLMMLTIAVLAGYGLNCIFERFNSRFFNIISDKNLLVIIFSFLILFEFLSVPYPMSTAKIPEFYNELAKDSEDYAIFEIPDLGGHLSFTEYMYYQTFHKKRLITGYTHVPESSVQFKENTPFIQDLHINYWDQKEPILINDILNFNQEEVGSSILKYYNIQYIIIHKNFMTKEQFEFVNNLINNTLKEKPQIYDDSLIVYNFKNVSIKTFITLKDNWYSIGSEKIPHRYMSNNASILIYSTENRTSNISFDVLSFYEPRILQVYINNELIHEEKISTDFTKIKIQLNLNKDSNILKFYTPNGCLRPIDISKLNDKDLRCLSLAYQNITFLII